MTFDASRWLRPFPDRSAIHTALQRMPTRNTGYRSMVDFGQRSKARWPRPFNITDTLLRDAQYSPWQAVLSLHPLSFLLLIYWLIQPSKKP